MANCNHKEAAIALCEKRIYWLLASITLDVRLQLLKCRAAKEYGWKKGYFGGHKNTFSVELNC